MTLRLAFFPFQMLHFSVPISYPFLALSSIPSRSLSAFFCIVCIIVMYRQSLCRYRWYASHFDIIMHILEPNQIHKLASADNIDCNVDCNLTPRLFTIANTRSGVFQECWTSSCSGLPSWFPRAVLNGKTWSPSIIIWLCLILISNTTFWTNKRLCCWSNYLSILW